MRRILGEKGRSDSRSVRKAGVEEFSGSRWKGARGVWGREKLGEKELELLCRTGAWALGKPLSFDLSCVTSEDRGGRFHVIDDLVKVPICG
jgi:hypothetical protein